MTEFAKIAEVAEGSVITVDGGFTCLKPHSTHHVKQDAKGQLYIECREGGHLLDGQKEGDHYVGIYLVTPPDIKYDHVG